MIRPTRDLRPLAIALAIPFLFNAAAKADQIRITVTNNQPSGGFAIAPVWLGLHDGSFSSFRQGDDLNGTPLQVVAELGSTAAITAAFAGTGPQTTVGGSPFAPGTSASSILDVRNPAATRFLNYAAMIVPSNDFFFGNDASRVVTLFDSSGRLIDANGLLTSTRTISIFGNAAWDAGTEVNNIGFGAAFIAGDDINDHVAQGGRVQPVFGGGSDNVAYLNSINGRLTAGGYNISHLISPGDLIATIQITAVPEPATVVLSGLGLLVPIALWTRSRRSSRP